MGVWDTVGALGMPVRGLRFINRLMGLEFHDVKLSSTVDHACHAVAIDEKRKPFMPALWEQQAHAMGQKMEQAWFAGVHSNIGGGYEDAGLSDIAPSARGERSFGNGRCSRNERCFHGRSCRRLRKSCATGSGGYLFYG